MWRCYRARTSESGRRACSECQLATTTCVAKNCSNHPYSTPQTILARCLLHSLANPYHTRSGSHAAAIQAPNIGTALRTTRQLEPQKMAHHRTSPTPPRIHLLFPCHVAAVVRRIASFLARLCGRRFRYRACEVLIRLKRTTRAAIAPRATDPGWPPRRPTTRLPTLVSLQRTRQL